MEGGTYLYKSAVIEKENRDIFSAILNYKHSNAEEQNHYKFLMAHLSEHILLENACRYIQSMTGRVSTLNKYISGLTNMNYTSFHLLAGNNYHQYLDIFVKAIENRELRHITAEHVLQQKMEILKEYNYPEFSFQGCSNIFFDFIENHEEIKRKEIIDHITMEEVLEFMDTYFSFERLSMTYIGKAAEGSGYEYNSAPENGKCQSTLYMTESKNCIKNINNTGLGQTWFGSKFNKISTLRDYYEVEIIAKVVHFSFRYLMRSKHMDIPIEYLGTHYTEKGSYFLLRTKELFSPETIFRTYDLNLEYIVREVLEEYKERLIIKLDSIQEFAKFTNKIFLLTDTYFRKPSCYAKMLDTISAEHITDVLLSLTDFKCINFLQ